MSATGHILHVETGKHLYGGALQVDYLAHGLAARGWRNTLVCTEGSAIAESAADAAEVRPMTMRGDLDIGFVRRLRRLIRATRPDLVHLHSRRGADVLGAIAARLEGVPVILSRRVDNPEARWWARLKYRLYDRVVTISDGIRYVLEEEGVPAGSITCVPSAVDTERFSPGCDGDWFRNEFALVSAQPVIAIAAQLIRRKGHRYLLEALPGVLERFPDLRVLVFGQGPLEAELREEIAARSLSENVWMAGFRDDLDHVLPCLDVVVHPADMEGLGVALLQAAACGVPIVATAAGGIPEIVVDHETGRLLPPGDVDGIRDALIALLDDPEGARALGAAGRRRVEEHFSIPAMVEGNIAVYRALLAAS
ncbi:MAG: glycosyltransferase [Pseudomonadota bacterium]